MTLKRESILKQKSITDVGVQLVCPGCSEPLTTEPCPCLLSTKIDYYEGITRISFKQNYLAEINKEKLAQVLEVCKSMHWEEALDNEMITQYKASVGPDFVYAMPWDEIHDVLDIGAGKGVMTELLAKYARKVIAIDPVPERALFLRRRAEQDNLPIYPIIASMTELPFADSQFDLITLNGVFEYLGLWAEGDPQLIQTRFLQQAFKLLRPGGFLYIGSETRYGLQKLFSKHNHSSLKYISLMPRKFAYWYCKLKSMLLSGHQQEILKYRVNMQTPMQYAEMFRQVGLKQVQVFGAFGGYDRQIGIYDLNQASVCNEIHSRVDAPISYLGRIKRLFTMNPAIAKRFEDEVLVVGRKEAQGSLFWPGLSKDGFTAQINSFFKYFAISFDSDAVPTTISEFAKLPSVEYRCQREFQMIQQMQELFGNEVHQWKMRWPMPIEQGTYHGRTFYRYEYLRGVMVYTLIFNTFSPIARQLEMIDQIIDAYLMMCSKLTSKLNSQASVAAEKQWLEELAEFENDFQDSNLKSRMQQARDYIYSGVWTSSVIHGDLHYNNIIYEDDNKFLLCDWENISLNGLVAIDLVRLCYDTIFETRRLPKQRAEAIVARTIAALKRVGATLGVRSQDWKDIETIYLAHLVRRQRSQLCLIEPFHDIYLSREFTDRMIL